MNNKIKFFMAIAVVTFMITLQGCSKERNKSEQTTETKPTSQGEQVSESDCLTNQENIDSNSQTDETEKTETSEEDDEVELTASEKAALEAEQILKYHAGKNLTYRPLLDPEDKYNLNIVKNTHMIAVETGEYSINQTKTKYGVGGTDLGISFNMGDKTYIFFGDTFLNEPKADMWRSNILAVTTDMNYTDGILFDSMITEPGETIAKELIPSFKTDYVEKTTIATGAIAIGETMYASYMSVNHWGDHGEWYCNFGSIAKSVDYGQNWKILKELRWPGDSHFCQMAPVIVDDYVYIMGITGGRRGPAKMMRVLIDDYENFDAYEYLMGYDDMGTPLYEKGEEAMYEAYSLLPKAGELSILYSDYLEEWLVTYTNGQANIVMRSSKNIDGSYSNPVTVVAQSDFPTLYCAFMNPKWVSEDGTKIAFFMSLWDPVYNTVLMECELER